MCSDQGLKKKESERRRNGLHIKDPNVGGTITFGINSGDGDAQFHHQALLMPLHDKR
ncbi:MAG: hypothetical protein VXV73_01810 [Actinomycetota bacterium]|nr:hypothetical protein [Actinomycetota bacterium]